MEQNKDTIKKLAEEFTSLTFGNDIPYNFCFLTCFPLSILFDFRKINHTISCGDYSLNSKNTPHVWLTLDNEGIILDPTIRQFDMSLESVYIGKLTENYVPVAGTFKEWFDNSYQTWTAPLLNTLPRTPRTEGFEEITNLQNIKTASILYKYLGALGNSDEFIKNSKCKFYFTPIFKFLQDKINSDNSYINMLHSSMPKDFEILLSKALSSK